MKTANWKGRSGRCTRASSNWGYTQTDIRTHTTVRTLSRTRTRCTPANFPPLKLTPVRDCPLTYLFRAHALPLNSNIPTPDVVTFLPRTLAFAHSDSDCQDPDEPHIPRCALVDSTWLVEGYFDVDICAHTGCLCGLSIESTPCTL